jgi:hypothetical protein
MKKTPKHQHSSPVRATFKFLHHPLKHAWFATDEYPTFREIKAEEHSKLWVTCGIYIYMDILPYITIYYQYIPRLNIWRDKSDLVTNYRSQLHLDHSSFTFQHVYGDDWWFNPSKLEGHHPGMKNHIYVFFLVRPHISVNSRYTSIISSQRMDILLLTANQAIYS